MLLKEYRAVERFPILKAYLHHFSQTSMKNEMPGLLSFFFIQGQTSLPYIRLLATHILTCECMSFGFNRPVQGSQSLGTSSATLWSRLRFPLSCSHRVQMQG